MRKEISKIFKDWKSEAGIDSNQLLQVSAYPDSSPTIMICTSNPGLMIGVGGKLVCKYTAIIKKYNKRLKEIKFMETDEWYIK